MGFRVGPKGHHNKKKKKKNNPKKNEKVGKDMLGCTAMSSRGIGLAYSSQKLVGGQWKRHFPLLVQYRTRAMEQKKNKTMGVAKISLR